MLPLLLGHLFLPILCLAEVRLPISLIVGLGIWLELDQPDSYCDWFRNEYTIQARPVFFSMVFSQRLGKNSSLMPSVVVHAWNPNSQGTEVGRICSSRLT